MALGGEQAKLLLSTDIPAERLTVVPNLGIRLSRPQLEHAAQALESEVSSRVLYIGRLSKEKGAHLLPEVARGLPAGALMAFGDGYLAPQLHELLALSMGGQVSQEILAGWLQWAKAVVFPSLWPEPGGIVGIDAQLFGVPLAAFRRGSALDWPQVSYFDPTELSELSRWLSRQETLCQPRSAESISRRQARYWKAVGNRAAGQLEHFVEHKRFSATNLGAVAEDLTTAIGSEPGSAVC